MPCRLDPTPEDPAHRVCTPKPYVSSFAWDAADNTLFRPLTRVFALDGGGEATNVNALDEVPDSSWFENRLGVRVPSLEDMVKGPCKVELDPGAADGTWVIDKGKSDGATPGFRVKVPNKGKFMLKGDFDAQPERPSAASAIGVRLYHAVGFHVSCDAVVYFKPSLLKLTPGLTVTTNAGVTSPFDEKALDLIVTHSPKRGEAIRMQSSEWLPGLPLGPFKYDGVRADDPNDIIPHEDRRELRGGRLLAAWMNHFDAREQNTMSVWMADDRKHADSSPGYIKHFYLDTSDSFGSEWDWDGISRRLGFSHYLDLPHVGQDFVSLGLVRRRWLTVERPQDGEIFGYYRADDFDAATWHAGYPNPTFDRMTERDGAWMARILARFTPEHLGALVKKGDFSEKKHEQYLLDTLLTRQQRVLRRYLGKLSPVTDLVVKGSRICGVDLARKSGLFSAGDFKYEAALLTDAGEKASDLVATAAGEAEICIELPSSAPPAGMADDDGRRYRVVRLRNRQAPGSLWVHLYDLGPERGLVLAGIERMPS